MVPGKTGANEAGRRVRAVVITVVNGRVSAFIDTWSLKKKVSNMTDDEARRNFSQATFKPC